mmetsp:Transcript_79373/g.184190  ORF Transcript_79373/g.184190 Transcript_79373/m.184190 type:complete len:136 (-) Transcript_79373:148-555(-)
MQFQGLDTLAAQHNAVACYLYVPKALVKRKGFNLEWSSKDASASSRVQEATEKLESSGLLVEMAVDIATKNSKTLLCCISVPDVNKTVEVMGGEFVEAVKEAIKSTAYSAKVVKWTSPSSNGTPGSSFATLLITN